MSKPVGGFSSGAEDGIGVRGAGDGDEDGMGVGCEVAMTGTGDIAGDGRGFGTIEEQAVTPKNRINTVAAVCKRLPSICHFPQSIWRPETAKGFPERVFRDSRSQGHSTENASVLVVCTPKSE
jgi:hypothetical protein